MHYTGTIWRPPYEAASLLLEVTAGCTHHKCKFCTLYHDLPFRFRMSPMEDIECDLREVKRGFKGWNSGRIDRVFLTGANPFVLSYDKLAAIAELIHKYLSAPLQGLQMLPLKPMKNLPNCGLWGMTV